MKIVVKTGNTDLHSGLYGGAVLNAGTVISNLLSKIVDSKNNVLIPCFDNGVDKITTEQLVNVNKMETPEVKSLTLNQGEKFFSKIALMPTIQITGIKLGYTGEGFNNIVPGEAEARINIRTVSSQDGNIIEELIRNFITENLPTGIECEITSGGKYNPVKLNTDSKMHNRARLSLKKAFGINPLLKYVGGSLPFVTDIKKIYGIDTILVPLGSDNSNAHGPNENYSLDIIEKGFAFSLDFFKK